MWRRPNQGEPCPPCTFLSRVAGGGTWGPAGMLGPWREVPPSSSPRGRAARCFKRNEVVDKVRGPGRCRQRSGAQALLFAPLGVTEELAGRAESRTGPLAAAHGDPRDPLGSRLRVGRWGGTRVAGVRAAPGVYLKLGTRPRSCLCEPGNAGEGPERGRGRGGRSHVTGTGWAQGAGRSRAGRRPQVPAAGRGPTRPGPHPSPKPDSGRKPDPDFPGSRPGPWTPAPTLGFGPWQ